MEPRKTVEPNEIMFPHIVKRIAEIRTQGYEQACKAIGICTPELVAGFKDGIKLGIEEALKFVADMYVLTPKEG